MLRFHALAGWRDQGVGGADDICGRPVVFDQKLGLCLVILGKAADEFDRGSGKGVDVLVVVADGKEVEFAVFIAALAPGQGRDQRVLFGADVLVFIDQNPAESGEQAIPLLIGVFR